VNFLEHEMKTQDALNHCELVSAMMDGQLRGKEFARAVELVGETSDARAAWHDFHLVGSVLRSGARMAGGGDPAFVARVRLRLQAQGNLLQAEHATDLLAHGASAPNALSANEPIFRWKMVAGLASLAAVLAIGWNAVSLLDAQKSAAQLAQVAAQPAWVAQQTKGQGGEPQVMIRDPRLDELLAAHKQFGGTSALQMPSGFLRNATFEGTAR
jgi:sigma-E factor negative regulatory protein RseA